MFQYLVVLLGVMVIIGQPALEALATAGTIVEYLVAFGIALLLKPWLEYHLD